MRPKLRHHILTGISALSLLGVTVYTVVRYGSLPDRIPAHFDAAGVVDSYGPKSGVIVLLLLGWFLFGVLTVISFFPNLWNVPKRNARTLAATADILAVVKLVTTLMFDWIVLCSVQGWNLGKYFLPAIMVGMFSPLVYLLIAAVRK